MVCFNKISVLSAAKPLKCFKTSIAKSVSSYFLGAGWGRVKSQVVSSDKDF